VSVNGSSPFRADAIERYARTRQAAVSVRRPGAARLAVLWLLLLLAVVAGGAWLILAWRYLAA
jgi:hypothetical protein